MNAGIPLIVLMWLRQFSTHKGAYTLKTSKVNAGSEVESSNWKQVHLFLEQIFESCFSLSSSGWVGDRIRMGLKNGKDPATSVTQNAQPNGPGHLWGLWQGVLRKSPQDQGLH